MILKWNTFWQRRGMLWETGGHRVWDTYKKPRENIPTTDHFRFEVICKVLITNNGRQTMTMSKDMWIAPTQSWKVGSLIVLNPGPVQPRDTGLDEKIWPFLYQWAPIIRTCRKIFAVSTYKNWSQKPAKGQSNQYTAGLTEWRQNKNTLIEEQRRYFDHGQKRGRNQWSGPASLIIAISKARDSTVGIRIGIEMKRVPCSNSQLQPDG